MTISEFVFAAVLLAWVPRVSGFSIPSRFSFTGRAELAVKMSSKENEFDYALLFDCDGVILETEELHRQAYNAAFEEFDLKINGDPVKWSVEYYDMLQNTVAGGKPKMLYHFRNVTKQFPLSKGQPAGNEDELLDEIQSFKTKCYKQLVASTAQPRPGLLSLMDEALNDPAIAVGVCSASTKEAAIQTLDVTLGPERVSKLNCCILGDDVSEKKPHPMIYLEAAKRLQLDPEQCIVIEDSLVGLRAARQAGMECIITYTESTASCDFYGEGAVAKLANLSEVRLKSIFDPVRERRKKDILANLREPLQSPEKISIK